MIITIAVAALISAVTIIGFPFYTYKDHKVDSGKAYGFVIGESKLRTYERAVELYSKGKYEVFEVGRGSAAIPHDLESPDDALQSDHWQLVVDPDWWNNVIYLEFSGDSLTRIWRFRLCCEGP